MPGVALYFNTPRIGLGYVAALFLLKLVTVTVVLFTFRGRQFLLDYFTGGPRQVSGVRELVNSC